MKNYHLTKVQFKKNWILKKVIALYFLMIYFSAAAIADQPKNVARHNMPILLQKTVMEQQITIKGKVTDMEGEPLPGVNIVEKGTTNGAITDLDGEYTISISSSQAVLSFSYVGYLTEEIQVANQTNIDVILVEDIQALDEVVVVGYGRQKKETMVGAVSNVTSAELERTGGVSNLGQALTGQLAGLATIISTGEPGNDDPTILIRGQSTWNEAQPLILVDGIERKMSDVDVNEVESISILKDASATAVFGVKGAEGVILITTKRGRIGKPQFSVEGSVGVKVVSRTPDKLDSYEALKFINTGIENELPVKEDGWVEYMPVAKLNRYRKPQAPGDEYIFPNVDWPKETLNDYASSQHVNMNVSGGTEFAKYFASLSYLNEGDLLKSELDLGRGYKAKWGYQRFNYRTNIDFDLTKSTVLSANISGYVGTKFENFLTSNGDAFTFTGFYGLAPSAFPVRFPDGSFGYSTDFDNELNPVQTINAKGLEKEIRTQVNTDFKLKQKLDFITQGLEVQASVSYDNLFYTTGGIFDGGTALRKHVDADIIDVLPGGVYSEEAIANLPAEIREQYISYTPNQGSNFFDYVVTPPTYYSEGSRETSVGHANSNYLNMGTRRLFYQFQINYAKQIGQHDLTALALMNREEYARGSMFPRYREDWVGRITYNYVGKYLFESNAAYNGSEKFADDYRFGFFPSVALGWVASKESFLQYEWLDNLKFRFSYGKVGNDNFDAPRWSYETTWRIDQHTIPLGYPAYVNSPYNQIVEAAIGNPDLHWETAIKRNIGIELGVLHLITVNAEIFKDRRKDIFMDAGQRQVVAYFGAAPVAANLGKTETTGYEIELKFRKAVTSVLSLWANAAYTYAIDEVKFMEDPELLPDYQKKAGFQINQTTSYIHNGFLTNWDDIYASSLLSTDNEYKLPGNYNLIDFNADGKVDNKDVVPYGYPTRPQNTYNLTLGVNYKGLSAHVQFYGVYNVTRNLGGDLQPYSDGLDELVFALQGDDYYTAENTDAAYRAPRYRSDGNVSNSSFYLIDGSYLRLKTAEISYNIANSWLKNIGISSARVYLNGNNLFLWSDMPDDRETTTLARAGVRYPTYKRFNLGMNIIF